MPLRHERHCGRAPSHDLGNLGDWSSGIQHSENCRAPKIVEAAGQRCNPFFGVRPFRLASQNLGCTQSGGFPSFLDAPDVLGWVNVVCLRTELITSRAVPFRRVDVMLWLAVREMCCPKAEGSNRPLTERNYPACPGSRLVFAPFQAAILKVHTSPLQGPNHTVPRPCLNCKRDKRNQRARAGLAASLEQRRFLFWGDGPPNVVPCGKHVHFELQVCPLAGTLQDCPKGPNFQIDRLWGSIFVYTIL